VALLLWTHLPAHAQDLEVGRTGWQLERLSDRFVLLRAEIHEAEASKSMHREGLLLLTCDHQARRVRFQIGDAPHQPSTQAAEFGRAMVQGEREGRGPVGSLTPRVRFYPDGSFEFLEAIGFSDSVMRDFLQLLRRLPSRIEVLLFKGPDTGAFRRGTVVRLSMRKLNEDLAALYGFEGLCYRAPD